MTITEDMVEKAARAMAFAESNTWVKSPSEWPVSVLKGFGFIDAARAALSAVIPEGYVVVPVEPTGEMLEAGRKAQKKPRLHVSHTQSDEFMTLAVGYCAMLSARPGLSQTGGER